MTGLREKLREVQWVCEDGDEPLFAAIVTVVELACKGGEVKHKNATVSEQNTETEVSLLEARSAESLIRA